MIEGSPLFLFVEGELMSDVILQPINFCFQVGCSCSDKVSPDLSFLLDETEDMWWELLWWSGGGKWDGLFPGLDEDTPYSLRQLVQIFGVLRWYCNILSVMQFLYFSQSAFL